MDENIGQTIADQIGFNALYMLGASHLIAHEDGVAFRIKGSKTGNHVRITLNPRDLYDLKFSRVNWRNGNRTETGSYEDIGCEQLAELISDHTGLAISI